MIDDALERRYDGPIPPADPAHSQASISGRARLFERLAAETVAETARHRARLDTESARASGKLRRLTLSLAAYRRHGLAWQRPG